MLVKCTQTIHKHVVEEINKLFVDRMKEAYELRGITELEVGQIIYELTHTPVLIAELTTIQRMHEDYKWMHPYSRMFFNIQLGDIKRAFQLVFPSDKPMLAQYTSLYGAPTLVNSIPDRVKLAITEAHIRQKAVAAEREEFKKSFKDIWEKVRSVNELVKLWPAGIELLPDGTMPRINMKSGPRAKLDETIDTVDLNVSLLKAKVAK